MTALHVGSVRDASGSTNVSSIRFGGRSKRWLQMCQRHSGQSKASFVRLAGESPTYGVDMQNATQASRDEPLVADLDCKDESGFVEHQNAASRTNSHTTDKPSHRRSLDSFELLHVFAARLKRYILGKIHLNMSHILVEMCQQ